MATPLYKRMLALSMDDPDGGELMRKVWDPTPYMIDVRDFEPNSKEWFDFLRWALEELGEESSPIHDQAGVWRRGNATLFGWTWYGFAAQHLMDKFMRRYPDRITNPEPQQ
jgi:hypothetical protein